MKTIYELFESDNLSKKEFEKQQKILKELNDVLLPFVEGSTLREKEITLIKMPFNEKLRIYSKLKKVY
jgi:hypothetical protein